MAAMSRARSRATVGWRGRIRSRLGTDRSETGAVLVEAAFVFPVFMLLLFGMIEFGFIFKDSLTLSTMVQTGARTGAVIGNGSSPSADYEILSTMAAESKALNAQVQSVVIFDANSAVAGVPLSAVPAQCLSASVNALCNYYSASDWQDIVTGAETGQHFAGACSSSCWDALWPPSSRQVAESSNGGTGPDFLGIYITAHHTKITGFFGSVDLHETDIIRLEPQSFG
ncbi:MAG TPA: TadE family protein [Acidimicrobiales bacterium]|nr:TadE family protein [Acidimicrobiales bacterium]